jgi:hypothetical protein
MAGIEDKVLKDSNMGGGTTIPHLKYGGQGGQLPNLGIKDASGKVVEAWSTATPYVAQNVIPQIVKFPKAFDLLPNADEVKAIFKALMEEEMLTIEGLASGITIEVDETPMGAGGHTLKTPTKSLITQSNVTYMWKERGAKAIQKFWDFYSRYILVDPITNKPLIANLIEDIDAVGGEYTHEWFSWSMMFIEPDITQKKVVDSWLTIGMFPLGNGDRVGKRDIKTAGEVSELSIEMACTTYANEGIMDLAADILSKMTVLTKSPDEMILPVDGIDATVAEVETGFDN